MKKCDVIYTQPKDWYHGWIMYELFCDCQDHPIHRIELLFRNKGEFRLKIFSKKNIKYLGSDVAERLMYEYEDMNIGMILDPSYQCNTEDELIAYNFGIGKNNDYVKSFILYVSSMYEPDTCNIHQKDEMNRFISIIKSFLTLIP